LVQQLSYWLERLWITTHLTKREMSDHLLFYGLQEPLKGRLN